MLSVQIANINSQIAACPFQAPAGLSLRRNLTFGANLRLLALIRHGHIYIEISSLSRRTQIYTRVYLRNLDSPGPPAGYLQIPVVDNKVYFFDWQGNCSCSFLGSALFLGNFGFFCFLAFEIYLYSRLIDYRFAEG